MGLAASRLVGLGLAAFVGAALRASWVFPTPSVSEASHKTRSVEPYKGRRPEPYARSAPFTRRSTASYIAGVTVPVFVFCLDG